ncbi:MAG: hypothetical protein Q4B36_00920 [Tissierellia bacterium]|nr:hypothetical protein [Tissierellia bacterium]
MLKEFFEKKRRDILLNQYKNKHKNKSKNKNVNKNTNYKDDSIKQPKAYSNNQYFKEENKIAKESIKKDIELAYKSNKKKELRKVIIYDAIMRRKGR